MFSRPFKKFPLAKITGPHIEQNYWYQVVPGYDPLCRVYLHGLNPPKSSDVPEVVVLSNHPDRIRARDVKRHWLQSSNPFSGKDYCASNYFVLNPNLDGGPEYYEVPHSVLLTNPDPLGGCADYEYGRQPFEGHTRGLETWIHRWRKGVSMRVGGDECYAEIKREKDENTLTDLLQITCSLDYHYLYFEGIDRTAKVNESDEGFWSDQARVFPMLKGARFFIMPNSQAIDAVKGGQKSKSAVSRDIYRDRICR